MKTTRPNHQETPPNTEPSNGHVEPLDPVKNLESGPLDPDEAIGVDDYSELAFEESEDHLTKKLADMKVRLSISRPLLRLQLQSRKTKRRPLIHPDDLKKSRLGEAFVTKPNPGSDAVPSLLASVSEDCDPPLMGGSATQNLQPTSDLRRYTEEDNEDFSDLVQIQSPGINGELICESGYTLLSLRSQCTQIGFVRPGYAKQRPAKWLRRARSFWRP